MIKDILVHLALGGSRDVAGEYAVSVASAFDAHLTGIAFAYQPVIQGTIFDGFASSVIWLARKTRELQMPPGRNSRTLSGARDYLPKCM
jgi:hypothetical protein